MTDQIVIQILQAAGFLSPLNVEEIMFGQLQSQMATVKASIDQLTLKEIYAGFDALQDAVLSDNAETKRRRLEFAESALMNNTRLDPDLESDDIPNGRLMAVANFGLAHITLLRGDRAMASRHVLKCYLADPRHYRQSLLPTVFKELFEEHCLELHEEFQRDIKKIKRSNFETQRKIDKFCYGTAAVVLGGLASLLNPTSGGVAGSAIWQAGSRKTENIKEYRKEALAERQEELEEEIDLRCVELAKEQLESLGQRNSLPDDSDD